MKLSKTQRDVLERMAAKPCHSGWSWTISGNTAKALLRRGYVENNGAAYGRRYFRISDAGRKALEESNE